jgi:hypothetical protein
MTIAQVGTDTPFKTALIGYDVKIVDATFKIVEAWRSDPSPTARLAAIQALSHAKFPRRLGGYRRRQVDHYVARMLDRLVPPVSDQTPT